MERCVTLPQMRGRRRGVGGRTRCGPRHRRHATRMAQGLEEALYCECENEEIFFSKGV